VLIRSVIFRLVRSGGAGIFATAADIGTLTLLVKWFGVPKVVASTPAFILGSLVMFLGHKYFVFEQRSAKTLGRETLLFVVVQAVGIIPTTLVFQILLGLSPLFERHFVLVRLVANNLVWLGYFFPLWHFVFKAPAKEPVVAWTSAAPEVGGEKLDLGMGQELEGRAALEDQRVSRR
jgi:putative flippase GtrA